MVGRGTPVAAFRSGVCKDLASVEDGRGAVGGEKDGQRGVCVLSSVDQRWIDDLNEEKGGLGGIMGFEKRRSDATVANTIE